MRSRRITVCGHEWTLREHAKRWDAGLDGECSGPPLREIRIYRSGDREADRETLYHELVHAVEMELGAPLKHRTVREIACVLARARL